MEPIVLEKSEKSERDMTSIMKPMAGLNQEMFAMRETHKYIFFGPARKDVKNTYFEAVYLFEKKLRIQAGQKVVLAHSKETYGVALVGQAQNRQVWVWLVSFQTEDVMKRLIVQVADIIGVQSNEEQEMCRNALTRYQRKSASYRALVSQGQENADSSPTSGGESPENQGPIRIRRLRMRSEETSPSRPKRAKKAYNRHRDYEEEYEEEDESFEFADTESEEEAVEYAKPNPKSVTTQRMEHGELFMTLLECVVMTLQNEYPQAVKV